MPRELTERSRRVLKRYYIALQILGWLTVTAAILRAVQGGPHVSESVGQAVRQYLQVTWASTTVVVLLAAVVALIVAQFLRYLFDDTYEKKWLLRNAGKVLCVKGCLVGIHYLLGRLLYLRTIAGDDGLWPFFLGTGWTQFAVPTLQVAVYVTIMLALGMAIGRVLQTIDEARRPA